MSIIFKPVSDIYKKLVHVKGENAYPWLDRVISYGLPTAGAVLYSALGTHANYDLSNKTGSYWGLPAGLAFYGVSQVGLTYLKPLVEVKGSDGIFTKTGKGVADFGIKLLDVLNNVAPYTIAYNMLPGTAGLNEVAAFRVMPEIVSAVESDIKATVDGTKYEGAVAGSVFASAAAGFATVNLRDFFIEKASDPSNVANIGKVFDEKLTSTVVESVCYPLFKKLLMTTKYESDEIEQDILKSLTKALYNGSSASKFFERPELKDSVFEGILLFAVAECVPLFINYASRGIADIDLDFCDSHTEMCPAVNDDTLSGNIKGSL
jgi:hypothetical protein